VGWLGAAVDTSRTVDPLWHLAVAVAAILFNFAAFAAEYRLVVDQARLILEVKDQADRIRAAANPGGSPAEPSSTATHPA
jgi:hypothetical protein